jgi:8-oxo-dGTP pyrophosphatase MutT (NUDIX family)
VVRSHIGAVGAWFYSLATKRYFYLLRNDSKHPFTWGLAGGKIEAEETLMVALLRECTEELGFVPDIKKTIPIEMFTSADGHFAYHTFFCIIEDEFIPVLNHEHAGYAWIDSGVWPKPLHPGLWSTVNLKEVMSKVTQIEASVSAI